MEPNSLHLLLMVIFEDKALLAIGRLMKNSYNDLRIHVKIE